MRTKNKLFPVAMLIGITLATITNAQNITGSGTVDYVLKFTSTGSTAGNSLIQCNTTNVGISTAPNASYKLDVAGALNASGKIYSGQGLDAGTYGITNTGAISGATTISASSTVSCGSLSSSGAVSGTTITGSDDFNASTSTKGYKINGSYVLRHINGSSNILVGPSSGANISSGTNNSFLGNSSGYANTTGGSNTFQGYNSGTYNTTGNYNTISGFEAGKGVNGSSVYSNNSFFGYQAGFANTTGGSNTFSGYKSGYSNTSASENTFWGGQSGYSNTTGTSNVISGYNAGYYNVTGNSNSIYGYQAGYGVSTYSFSDVSFLGYKAGFSNKGNYNTFFGTYSGYTNGSAGYNTFIGYASGYAQNYSLGNTYNTFIGHNSGRFNTSGINLAFLGHQSGYNNTEGINNTFVGVNAGYANTTGEGNVAVGVLSGDSYSGETYSTFIGAGADANANSYTNTAAFGYNAVAQSSNKFYFGNASVSECRTTSWVSTSDGRFKFNVKEEVKGLEFIKKLRPVTYQMNTQQLNTFLRQDALQAFPDSIIKNSSDTAGFAASSNIIHSGFIAQEVQQAALECGFSSSIVSIPSNNNKETYGINYGEIVVPLVKAIQELSATIDSLKGVPTAKKATQDNDSLIKRIEQLESLMNQCCTANSDGQNQNSERQGTTIKENQMELISAAMLYQNSPNPFGDGTTIKYFVPENSQAQIIFYDEFGSVLKEFKVEEKGMGQLNISSINLASGSYSYSLIINGKVIDTKKMIKVK